MLKLLASLILIHSFWAALGSADENPIVNPAEARLLTCERALDHVEMAVANESPLAHPGELKKTSGPQQKTEDEPVVVVPLADTQIPISKWNVDQLQTPDGRRYIGLDVGFAKLAPDQAVYQQASLAHVAGPHSQVPLILQNEGERKAALTELTKWRWGLHHAVWRTYLEHPYKQDYLEFGDVASLGFMNQLNEDSDVFGVILDPQKPLTSLTQSEVDQNTVTTIQLTYAAYMTKAWTRFDSAQLALNAWDFQPEHTFLPFIFRMERPKIKKRPEDASRPRRPLPKLDISEFKKKFFQEFAGKKIAEINHWVKPMKAEPEALRDYVLLQLLERAEQTGVQILVASTDQATRRHFTRNYFFKDYHKFERPIVYPDGTPTGEFSEPEFLIYMVVGSPEYFELKNRVLKSVETSLHILQTPFLDTPH